jgi:hypothetical protein
MSDSNKWRESELRKQEKRDNIVFKIIENMKVSLPRVKFLEIEDE